MSKYHVSLVFVVVRPHYDRLIPFESFDTVGLFFDIEVSQFQKRLENVVRLAFSDNLRRIVIFLTIVLEECRNHIDIYDIWVLVI